MNSPDMSHSATHSPRTTLLRLPLEGSKMKFDNYKNQLERPFFVTYDTECSLCPTEDQERIARHEPNSICFYFVCTYDYSKNRLWRHIGEDCVEKFILELINTWQECLKEIKKNVKMSLSEKEEHIYIYILQVLSHL